MSTSLPTVSVLVTAYNYERYVGRALESALAQDYPARLIEVVVVDDGSTDATPSIVDDFVRQEPERIRLIRQSNRGATGSADRAIAEARGEMLAFLDADDVWLPEKTRRQVALLVARPDVGLVFSDMEVIDSSERSVRPSQLGPLGTLPPAAYARVLRENPATSSSIMVRGGLRHVFAPIPFDVPYADWWVTACVARIAPIDYIRDPLALYRVHGGNRTAGARGLALASQLRLTVDFQLRALRTLPLESLTLDEMLFVWSGVESNARQIVALTGSGLASAYDATPTASDGIDRYVAQSDDARNAGDRHSQALFALRALAADPSRLEAMPRFFASVTSPPVPGWRSHIGRLLHSTRKPAHVIAAGLAVLRWRYAVTRRKPLPRPGVLSYEGLASGRSDSKADKPDAAR